MKSICCLLITTFLLSGCQALNFQTEPKTQENCQYSTRQGVEFQFAPLPIEQVKQGYSHIYVAQSKESATLSSLYQGLKGKLTGNIIERNYPKSVVWGHRSGPFRESLLYDDHYEDIYLTAQQREARDRKAKYLFQQALLENCQVVYISVDSLAKNTDDFNLIESANVKIINN